MASIDTRRASLNPIRTSDVTLLRQQGSYIDMDMDILFLLEPDLDGFGEDDDDFFNS